jgi:hypothetical protein
MARATVAFIVFLLERRSTRQAKRATQTTEQPDSVVPTDGSIGYFHALAQFELLKHLPSHVIDNYADHLKHVRNVIGLRSGVTTLAAMQMLILPGRQLFICDTHVNRDPDAAALAEMTLLAAEEVQRFGLKPSVALVSHSSFGSSDDPQAKKMQAALDLYDLIIVGAGPAGLAAAVLSGTLGVNILATVLSLCRRPVKRKLDPDSCSLGSSTSGLV